MASSREILLICLIFGTTDTAVGFTSHAQAALQPPRARACRAMPKDSAPFAKSVTAKTLCALEKTRQPGTVAYLVSTQITLLFVKITQSAFGVAVDLAELFLSDKLVMRLSLGLCSVFFNNMLHTGKEGAFVVAQAVLAVFVVCTGGELAATFTVYSVFERLFVYKLALCMPTLLRQTKRHAHRVGSYMRMHVVGFRAFA